MIKKHIALVILLCLSIIGQSQIIYGELEKIVNSDRAANDRFGYTVSIDGDYAVVGAYSEDEDAAGANTLTGAGSAYIFEKDFSGNWVEVQKIVASDRAANDNFGWSVSISGTYLVVGANQEDEDAAGANTLLGAGSVYIFERDGGGVWNEVQKIVASDRGAGDDFGYAVSISGTYLVVGAFDESEDEFGANTMVQSGSAYVFERDGGGVWNEAQKLVASDRAVGDLLGTSVAISGTYLVLSARAEDEDEAGGNTLFGAGSAYVFERDGGGVWNEVQKIVASDRASNDIFGGFLAIDGTYIAVGAYQEDEDEVGGNTMVSSGSVYIYERDGGGVWNETQKVVANDRAVSDNFGWSVSLSGDLAVIGAYREDEDANGSSTISSAGSTYIFERNGSGTWNQIQKIVASDRASNDNFGVSVAVDGVQILVGAYREDEDENGINTLSSAGSAYVFEYCLTTSSYSVATCDSYTVPSGDETYTSSGVYNDTILNVAGCDSIMTINVTILLSTTNSISPAVCDSYTVPSGDETYIVSGVYTDTIPNAIGCDSIITINLSIMNSVSAFSVSDCFSYTVPSGDEAYFVTGAYMDTIPNFFGCDSVMTINLTINNTSNTLNEVVCETYTVPSGDETYTVSGVYNDTIPNAIGCDSLLTINLTVNYNSTGTLNEIVCDTYTVPSGDETYSVSGIYMDTIPNFLGCDSVLTINLSVNNSSTNSVTLSVCEIYTVPSGDETYTSSGIYLDTIPNFLGCDSIITIDLTINNSSANSVTLSVCEIYTVPSGDETYTSSGIYLDTIPNFLGCDSIITIDLTINNVTSSTINESACTFYTVPSGDETYSVSGIYSDTIANSVGCDSIITIDLTIPIVDVSVSQNGFELTAGATGAIYQWIDCNNGNLPIAGETNQVFMAPSIGDYAVIVTENSCTDTSICYNINDIGIEEENHSFEINVYPNPNSGLFIIKTEIKNNSYTISIVNILGEIVYEKTISEEEIILDLTYLNNGIYTIIIQNEGLTRAERMIIDK